MTTSIEPDTPPTRPPLIKNSKTRPSFCFVFFNPTHFIACGCGCGLSPYAPGTVGTLFGWVLFLLFDLIFNDEQFLIFLAAAYFFGIIACDITGRHLGEADHSSIVWDEIVPFMLVLFFCPRYWLWQLAAFFLFRFFDIVKPPPADYFDREVKNGFGVMTDDVFAALYTLVVLAIAVWFLKLF